MVSDAFSDHLTPYTPPVAKAPQEEIVFHSMSKKTRPTNLKLSLTNLTLDSWKVPQQTPTKALSSTKATSATTNPEKGKLGVLRTPAAAAAAIQNLPQPCPPTPPGYYASCLSPGWSWSASDCAPSPRGACSTPSPALSSASSNSPQTHQSPIGASYLTPNSTSSSASTRTPPPPPSVPKKAPPPPLNLPKRAPPPPPPC